MCSVSLLISHLIFLLSNATLSDDTGLVEFPRRKKSDASIYEDLIRHQRKIQNRADRRSVPNILSSIPGSGQVFHGNVFSVLIWCLPIYVMKHSFLCQYLHLEVCLRPFEQTNYKSKFKTCWQRPCRLLVFANKVCFNYTKAMKGKTIFLIQFSVYLQSSSSYIKGTHCGNFRQNYCTHSLQTFTVSLLHSGILHLLFWEPSLAR